MEHLKAKDLYVVSQLKLVKSESWRSLAFPYDALLKTKLIEEHQIPSKVSDAAKVNRKETFTSLAEDITIAKHEKKIGFFDVFTNEHLVKYYPNTNYRHFLGELYLQNNLVINQKYISILSPFLYYEKLEQGGYDLSDDDRDELYKRIDNMEFTINELKELNNRIIARSKNKEITFYNSSTKQYVGFTGPTHSYDLKGNPISPVEKDKVKEKRLHLR